MQIKRALNKVQIPYICYNFFMAKKTLTTIYIVRHGESTQNAGIHKGEKDHEIPLTLKGEDQAKELAKKFRGIHFDVAFSSDYLRAKKTAKLITLENKLSVKTTALIRERTFGNDYFNNREKIRAEMKEIFKKLTDEEKLNYKYTKDMESAKEGAKRLLSLLQEIKAAYMGKTILVVCHGNIMRSLLNILGWCKFDEIPENAIENTGYIKLETKGMNFIITETKGVNKKIGVARLM